MSNVKDDIFRESAVLKLFCTHNLYKEKKFKIIALTVKFLP